jgi:hypothetical protein
MTKSLFLSISLCSLTLVLAASGCGGPPIGPDMTSDAGVTPMGGSGYTWPTCSGRRVTRVRVEAAGATLPQPCAAGWTPAALSVAGGDPNVEGTGTTLDWTVPTAAGGATRLGFRCGTSTSPEVWMDAPLESGRTAASYGVRVHLTLEGSSVEADMSSQVTAVPGGGAVQLQVPMHEMCTRP